METVVFYRRFWNFQGGHLKVFHYFEHVRSSPAYEARIRFSEDSTWGPENPWSAFPDAVLGPQDPTVGDIRFLARMDWEALAPQERSHSPVPVINLIQGFSHTRPENPAHAFLKHHAIRLCVSEELAQTLSALDGVNGPVFTIPIGLDLESLPARRDEHDRDIDCVVLAIKDRVLGRSLARRLRHERYRVVLVDEALPRDELLRAVARARVSVHLPARLEGAYLPALESMALATAVVCPDAVGNRSFCRDGDTCLVPARNERALLQATLELLSAPAAAREQMLAAGLRESARHALEGERRRFLEILGRASQLWRQQ